MIASAFGSEGTPIDKTTILLDLQARVQALESEVAECCNVTLARLAALEAKVPVVVASAYFVETIDISDLDWYYQCLI